MTQESGADRLSTEMMEFIASSMKVLFPPGTKFMLLAFQDHNGETLSYIVGNATPEEYAAHAKQRAEHEGEAIVTFLKGH